MRYSKEVIRNPQAKFLDRRRYPTIVIDEVEILLPGNFNARILFLQLEQTLDAKPYPEETLRSHMDTSLIPPGREDEHFYNGLREVSRYVDLAGYEVVRTTMTQANGEEIRAVALKKKESTRE